MPEHAKFRRVAIYQVPVCRNTHTKYISVITYNRSIQRIFYDRASVLYWTKSAMLAKPLNTAVPSDRSRNPSRGRITMNKYLAQCQRGAYVNNVRWNKIKYCRGSFKLARLVQQPTAHTTNIQCCSLVPVLITVMSHSQHVADCT
jgi:hypothetical protein